MNFNIVKQSMLSLMVMSCILFSCDQGSYLETKSGFKAELIRKGDGIPVIMNGVAELNLCYETEDGRKLFDTNKRGGPILVKTSNDDRGTFAEVVNALSIGDSVAFEITAEDLFEKTYQLALPDSIEKGSMIKFNLSLNNTMTLSVMEALQHEEEEKRQAMIAQFEKEQLKKEIQVIDLFLSNNKIKALELDNGLRIVINKKGKGKKPILGDKVKAHYVGKFFENNNVFDQSNKLKEPLLFEIGGPVIEAWNIGFQELNEGSSATFYIPSPLAYGANGSNVIPPNSILIFDVDFVEIER